MLFEQNGLDLTGESLLTDDLGDTWLAFTKSITDHNTYIFNTGYNLIRISDPNTTVGLTINEILIDESRGVTEQTFAIRNLIITNIINIAQDMGITIDVDNVTIDDLPTLCKIVDLVYILDGFEDLLSLSAVLESKDLDPVDRFVRLIELYYDEDDLNAYQYLITDVNERTLEAIRLSLINHEHDELPVEKTVKDRILKNKAFLRNTLAWKHITDGGNIGGSFNILTADFKPELTLHEDADKVEYIRQVVALALVSDLANGEILDAVSQLISVTITDPVVLFKADALIEGLNLESTHEEA